MPNKEELPFHHYSETHQYVNILDGHPALAIDPEFPFLLTQFSYMHNRAQTETPHRHDYFEILFIEEVEGNHIIDYEPYNIKAPVMFFLSKGQIHFWKLSKGLKGKVIICAHISQQKSILSMVLPFRNGTRMYGAHWRC